MANQNSNTTSNTNNNTTNNNNTNTANSSNNHTLNLHHTLNNNNQTSPLIISSSQLLSSMPSLAVAAAAAGITTTLIPLSNELTNGTSNNTATSTTNNLATNSNTGLLDLIMCKLVAPFHVVNDPRLLECGSSACFQCIMSSKDSERNLKCPYCNNIHKIPIDLNKIVVNKNLQNFLKINFRQINQSFSKQLEDSMFALEQKIHSQNLSMENFDQYLTLIQNDVQMKVETMKNHLEKYGEQFIENLKLIRKEVQKNFQTCCNEYESRFTVYRQWIEHSNNNNNNTTTQTQTSSSTATLNNVVQQQQQQIQQLQQHQQQHQQHQLQQQHQVNKEKTFQLIGIKGEPLLQLQSNPNIMTLLSNSNNNNNGVNTNHSTYQLSSFHNPTTIQTTNTTSNTASNTTTSSGASSSTTTNSNTNHHSNNSNTSSNLNHHDNNNSKRNNNTTDINSTNKSNLLQHTGDTLNTSLDVLQNTFNFSNSSSWNANDDDLDDFDTELSLKPVQTSINSSVNGQKRHLNKEQAQFNKFVREEVSKKFGEDFLLQHEVNQLESSIMELIKTEAIATFLPKDTTPARAWTLAKVSLRSLKRDLRRKQGLSLKKETQDFKIVNHPYYDV